MEVDVEHRHELVEVEEQEVAEHRRMGRALAVLDDRRLEDDPHGAVDLDRPLEDLDGHEISARARPRA